MANLRLGSLSQADEIFDCLGRQVGDNFTLKFPSVVSKRANVSLGILTIVAASFGRPVMDVLQR